MPAKIIDFTAPHKRKTESEIRISEVEKMALDKKMSYGQYVAMLEEEKKKDEPQDKRAQARAALTDLFQSIKTEDTPIIVEQVVNDIDNEVVNIVRQFNDAFQSVTARREIKKKLRAILWVKYQIKDNDVFERAYQYIEMYY